MTDNRKQPNTPMSAPPNWNWPSPIIPAPLLSKSEIQKATTKPTAYTPNNHVSPTGSMAIPTINRTISIEKINGRPISNDEPLKINNGVTIVKDENTDDEDEIDYLKLILNARVYDVCKETELTYAKNLSR